ncbi:hypothetical protein HYH03_008169 [Edaphochlamys debaryana]|uniref:Uncharacterized protein n=1 Tax=Edaphochlamys debaryana TaxID=47281 RepID=A0A835Y9T0_9CHLO|nr:hypothetical protein HYH03_008169 [Edaphochlamys debaryana]|eukprot:KAG2493654.1 hypothetical protein HYH03_008169 [Edaphochlamys debaryana]
MEPPEGNVRSELFDECTTCTEWTRVFLNLESCSSPAFDTSSESDPDSCGDDEEPGSALRARSPAASPPRKRRGPAAAPVATDAAGDLVVARRRRRAVSVPACLTLRSTRAATPLQDVGLQLWRGACLLCDWLLAQPRGGSSSDPSASPGSARSCPLAGAHVFELGGGVGLGAMAALAAGAARVTLTDAHPGALRLAAENLAANAPLLARLRRSWGARQAEGAGQSQKRRKRQGRMRREQEPRQGAAGEAPGGSVLDAVGAVAEEGPQQNNAQGGGGGVRVDVACLDWMDFLTLGSGAATAEAIVGAVLESALATPAPTTSTTDRGPPNRPTTSTAEALPAPADSLELPAAAVREAAAQGLALAGDGGALAEALGALARAPRAVLVAADTVYDTALNEGFAKCAAALMSYRSAVRAAARRARHEGAGDHACAGAGPAVAGDRAGAGTEAADVTDLGSIGDVAADEAVLIVALERRVVFSVRHMREAAPALDDFLTYVRVEAGGGEGGGVAQAGAEGAGGDEGVQGSEQGTVGVVSEGHGGAEPRVPLFRGRRLDVEGLPRVLRYERSPQLELWELRLL